MSVGAVSGAGGSGIVSGASPYDSPTEKMANLFSQIDANGAGAINQDQFNQAFQTMNPPGVFRAAGTDAIFNQLDPKGTGNVSQADFVNTMTGLMKSLRSGPTSGADGASAGSPASSPANALASSLQALNQLGDSSNPFLNNGTGSAINVLA